MLSNAASREAKKEDQASPIPIIENVIVVTAIVRFTEKETFISNEVITV